MINTLSPDDMALMQVVRDDWLRIGLSTEPADRPRAQRAIADAYRIAGLTPPTQWTWVDSPDAAVRMLLQIRRQPGQQVGQQVWQQVGQQAAYGQHDAALLGFYDFFRRMTRAPAGPERLVPLMQAAQSAGWWEPFEQVCVISERPSLLRLDAQHRLPEETDMNRQIIAAQGEVRVYKIDALPDGMQTRIPPRTRSGAYIISHSESGHHQDRGAAANASGAARDDRWRLLAADTGGPAPARHSARQSRRAQAVGRAAHPRQARPVAAARTGTELRERVVKTLSAPKDNMLRQLIAIYPQRMPRDELARRIGYTNLTTKSFAQAHRQLVALGLVVAPGDGTSGAADLLFP
jgi:hypothetical protein